MASLINNDPATKRRCSRWLRRLGMLLTAALLLSSVSARAELVSWLYSVAVPVVDQSVSEREVAAADALQQLLIRISGAVELRLSPALEAALAAPQRYYTSFAYERPSLTAGLQVRFRFDPRSTLALNRALGLPVWWQNRPRVVPWIALDGALALVPTDEAGIADARMDPRYGDQDRDQARDNEGDNDGAAAERLALALLRRSRERGLPLALPRLDDEGLTPLAPDQVEGVSLLELASVSAELVPELLALGRVVRRGGSLHLRLTLASPLGDRPETFLIRAATATVLGERIVDQLADRFASRFAASGGGTLTVSVRGVDSAQRYVALLAYLRTLSFLDSFAVLESAPGQLLLQLESQAAFEQFLDLLAVDQRLAPDLSTALDASGFGVPVFTWQG